jgi:hypothetical protein
VKIAGKMLAGRSVMFHKKIDGVLDRVPQFDESDLDEPSREYGLKDWTFTGAMISTCAPLFDEGDMDNHDFEAVLRRKKVLRKNNRTDSESCQFWAYFSSKKSAMAFVARLNEYLAKRASSLRDENRRHRAALRSI